MQSYLRKQEEKEAKSYKGQMKPSKMKTNLGNNAGFEDEKTNVNTFEDDFM